MDLIDPNLQHYLEIRSDDEPELLSRLRRETHLKILYPRMLSGHLQGRFLAMVSWMVQPARILEIGTYTGYSCICLAEGLKAGGLIDTLELNEELEPMMRRYWKEANIESSVNLHLGPATDTLSSLQGPYDLVFIDADKGNYPAYFEAILPKVRQGGIILADNVLWSGKVLDTEVMDKETSGLRRFNELVTNDDRVSNVLLPLRDGVMMIYKK
ncbi:MAG: O-methyltransferase [Bacteroidota bacterium]